MTQPASALQAIVAEATVHLLYTSRRLDWAVEPSWSLRGFGQADHIWIGSPAGETDRCGPWLPPAWRPALTDRYDGQLWRRDDLVVVSTDLRKNIALLSGNAGSTSVRAYRPAEWEHRLAHLLDGRGLWPMGERGDERRTLVLAFSAKARERLAKSGWLGAEVALTIKEPRLFQFRSGLAILDMPVRIVAGDHGTPLPAAVIAEAVYALSRFNSLHWAQSGNRHTASFSMGDIARSLLEGPHGETRKEWRTYTVSFAHLEESASDMDAGWLGIALAKHYTADYAFRGAGDVTVEALHAFEGIQRYAALEGSAVVVAPGEHDVGFLTNYYTAAFLPAYLPLATLSLHEARAWQALFDRSMAWFDLDDERTSALATLREIRSRATQLSLAYDLNAVSAVGDHEQWKEALDKGHRLPSLRRALLDETAAIEALLEADHRRSILEAEAIKQSRTAWIAVIAAFFASWVTAFSLLKDVLAPTLKDAVWSLWPVQLSPPSTIAALIGIVAGAFAAGLAYWRLIARNK